MTNRIQPFGSDISTLTAPDAYLDWLFAQAERPSDADVSLKYAILQCSDTFVWGILNDTIWTWSSDVENAGVNAPTKTRLLEARIFGKNADVLIWKTSARFAGRILKDAALTPDPAQSPLERHAAFQPAQGEQALDGTFNPNYLVKSERFGFARRELPGGRITITPAGTHVLVREYLSETADGVLRVAATRFVEIE